MAYPKGKPKSEESKAKARAAMLAHYENDPEARKRRASFTGRKHSEETKRKMSVARSAYWTEDRREAYSKKVRRYEQLGTSFPGYKELHRDMNRRFPRCGVCDLCGNTPRGTHYAMRSPPFARIDPDDWLELCPSCHKEYDSHRIVWLKTPR